MRTFLFSGIVLSSFAAAASAFAEPSPTGVEVGLRSGYAVPLGQAAGNGTNGSGDLSKVFSGVIPIWVDAGYRLNPNFYIGGFFQYGIGLIPKDALGSTTIQCGQNGVSCSGSDIMLGVDAQYHLMPDGAIDPWVGIGVGYEIGNVNVSEAGTSAGESFNGFQFVNAQVGADYKPTPNFGIGPFVMFSAGEFANCSLSGAASGETCTIPQKAVHEWLTFGLRGVYDINL
jgi:opacity protein-like surface antigen